MPNFKDFKAVLKEKGIGGSGFLSLEEGENKVRIMSEPVDYVDVGKYGPQNKFMCWAINRADGSVQPFSFGPMIFEGIGNLATTTETAFNDLPPYDIIIKKSGSGIDTEYAVIASRSDTALTKEEKEMLEKAGDIKTVIDRTLAKNAAKLPAVAPIGNPSHDEIPVINEEDLPF